MKNIWIIFLTSIFLLFNCQSDKKKYYYFDKYDSMDVGDGKETFIHKSRKSNYYDTIIVYSDIVKFGENYSNMIVLQKPNKELMLKRITSSLEILYKYYSEKDSVVISFPHTYTSVEKNKQYKKDMDLIFQSTQDSAKTYQIKADKIFENELFYQKIYKNLLNYYIIDKKEDSVFGPMKKSEFIRLKRKRKIKIEFGETPFWGW